MKNEFDIHNTERIFETRKQCFNKNSKVEKNKTIVQEFIEHLEITGISEARMIRYLTFFIDFERCLIKPFDKVDEKDIKKYIAYMQTRNLAPATIYAHLVSIKRFYKWLKGKDEIYPPVVKWIKPRLKNSDKKSIGDGDLLTEEEVKKMIHVAENPRDKAFVSMLFESGCRIGELASLQIKNVKFDSNGIVLSVQGKTGARPVRVITSTPYLMNWLQCHPLKDDPNSPLWVAINQANRNEMLKYRGFTKFISNLAIKAGIKKKCNPHLFRHSRATQLANHLTEFQMDKYFGWTLGSKMPSTYVHLSGRDLDASLLEFNGMKNKDAKENNELKPKICPKCSTINTHDSKFCNNCAGILDVSTALELEEKQAVTQEMNELLNKLAKHPEKMGMFVSALRSLN